jgi:hypothetical protein
MMGYEKNIELKMQRLFETLSEKDKRRSAAVEVEKLSRMAEQITFQNYLELIQKRYVVE